MRIVSFNVNGFRGMLGQGDIISDEALYNNLQSLKEFIDSLDEDTVVTVVDCHI